MKLIHHALCALSVTTTLTGCLVPLSSLTGSSSKPDDNDDDDYQTEPPAEQQVPVKACAKVEFTVRAVQTGSDKWGTYQYLRRQWPKRIDCAQLPKKDNFHKSFADAVERGKQEYGIDGVVVWDGKYETLTDEEDYHVYQYATLVFYSPDFTFSNECGGDDLKLVCEASGSIAVTNYNQLVHNLARADVRRKQGNAERCNYLLELAVGRYTSFNATYDANQKDGSWLSGLTYRIRTGEKLTEDQMLTSIRTAGAKAQEQQRSGWCAKK